VVSATVETLDSRGLGLWLKTDARFVPVLYLGTCGAQASASDRGKRMGGLGRARVEPPFDFLAAGRG